MPPFSFFFTALILNAAPNNSAKAPLGGMAIPRSTSPSSSKVSPGLIPKISRACFGITICPFSPTVAEKFRAGEISKEDYDKWRYNYPKFDSKKIWAKVPPQDVFNR